MPYLRQDLLQEKEIDLSPETKPHTSNREVLWICQLRGNICDQDSPDGPRAQESHCVGVSVQVLSQNIWKPDQFCCSQCWWKMWEKPVTEERKTMAGKKVGLRSVQWLWKDLQKAQAETSHSLCSRFDQFSVRSLWNQAAFRGKAFGAQGVQTRRKGTKMQPMRLCGEV